MSVKTDIQRDIRALIVAELPSVAVYDRWAQQSDPAPYVTFGPIQRVANHAKEARYSIFYVTLHLWVRDSSGSVAASNLGESIVDALDMQNLPTAELNCYFEDSIAADEDDESMNHVVLSFQVR